MRASLVGSLLLMLFLLQEAQGIRLEKGFMHTQVGAQKFQADLGEEVIHCKEGHCRGTMEKRVSSQYCPRNLHVNGRQEFMKITADLGITNRDTISFSLIYRATMTDSYSMSMESTF